MCLPGLFSNHKEGQIRLWGKAAVQSQLYPYWLCDFGEF